LVKALVAGARIPQKQRAGPQRGEPERSAVAEAARAHQRDARARVLLRRRAIVGPRSADVFSDVQPVGVVEGADAHRARSTSTPTRATGRDRAPPTGRVPKVINRLA